MIKLRVNNIVNEIMIRHQNDPVPEISQEIERLESIITMHSCNNNTAIKFVQRAIKNIEEPILIYIQNLIAAKIVLRKFESERVQNLNKTLTISYLPTSSLSDFLDATFEHVSNLNDPGIEIKKETK